MSFTVDTRSKCEHVTLTTPNLPDIFNVTSFTLKGFRQLYVVIVTAEVLDIVHCLDVWNQIAQQRICCMLRTDSPIIQPSPELFFCVRPHPEREDRKVSVTGLVVLRTALLLGMVTLWTFFIISL